MRSIPSRPCLRMAPPRWVLISLPSPPPSPAFPPPGPCVVGSFDVRLRDETRPGSLDSPSSRHSAWLMAVCLHSTSCRSRHLPLDTSTHSCSHQRNQSCMFTREPCDE